MVEAQALDRVHRMGQTRDVVTTRYIVKDSIETVSQQMFLGSPELVFSLDASY